MVDECRTGSHMPAVPASPPPHPHPHPPSGRRELDEAEKARTPGQLGSEQPARGRPNWGRGQIAL